MSEIRIGVLDAGTLFPADEPFNHDHPMFAELRQFGEVLVFDCTALEDILVNALRCDALLNNKVPITGETLSILTNPDLAGSHTLKYASMLATGYDVFDVKAAEPFGIPCSNVPVYGTSAVKEYVYAGLLGGMRAIPHHCSLVQAKRWVQHGKFSMPTGRLDQLDGKEMGVIGAAGRIGGSVIQTARSFDMIVNGCDLFPRQMDDVNWMDNSEAVLRNSDIVTIHANWKPGESLPIVTMDTIQMMREGSILVNAARGQFVDLEAIKFGLQNGILATAILDVLPMGWEPPGQPWQQTALEELINLGAVITPHIAWFTRKSVQNLWAQTIQNISAWIAGKPINVVNFPQAA